jgi:hypothetical protein
MISLFTKFWQLCFFQAKPEDIPYSSVLMGFVIFVYFSLSMPFLMFEYSVNKSLLINITSLALTLFIWWRLLRYYQRENRMVQSLTALYGCWTIQLSMMVPLVTAAVAVDQSGNFGTAVYMAIVLWSLAISARILQYTLSISFQVGLLISVLLMLLEIFLIDLLFK